MTRAEALEWCRAITSGDGVDRDKYVDRVSRGTLAERYWDDGYFTLGVEYGVLIALIEAFDLDLTTDEQ